MEFVCGTRKERETFPRVRENFNPSKLYRFPQRLYITEGGAWREEKGDRVQQCFYTRRTRDPVPQVNWKELCVCLR